MNKIFKKSILSCFVFVFALSIGVESTLTVNAMKCNDLNYDDEGGFYTLSTDDDLETMACLVNYNSLDYTAATYHLMNDIDLISSYWIPIGTSLSPFMGTFVGNDHKISHLSILNIDTDGDIVDTATLFEAGFFGSLSNATISDLNFDQASITIETNAILSETEGSNRISRVGILAADAKDGTEISGITITDSTITINNLSTESDGLINKVKTNVGALVGESETDTIISEVEVDTDISIISTWDNSTEFNVGGILGVAFSTQLSETYFSGVINFGSNQTSVLGAIGGLIGNSDTVDLSNSGVQATLNVDLANGEVFVGGISGLSVNLSSYDQLSFSGTINSNTIFNGGLIGAILSVESGPSTIISSSVVDADISGSVFTGGFIGAAVANVDLIDSSFDGKITTAIMEGGLVGIVAENIVLTILRSFSSGSLEVSLMTGGIYAYNSGGTVILTDVYSRMDLIYPDRTSTSSKFLGSSLSSMKPMDGIQMIIGGIGGQSNGDNDQYTNVYFAGRIIFEGVFDEPSLQDPFVNFEDTSPLKVQNIYYDHDLLPMDSVYATAKTTSEMKIQSTFVGFDFENVWIMLSSFNDGYPSLFVYLDKVTYLDGSSSSPVYVIHGKTITKPEDPSKTDFVFEGWFTDESLTTPWNFETGKVSADMALYAKWSAKLPDTGEVNSFGLIIGILSVGLLFITRRKKQEN